jgi:hypothetical protein
VRNACIRSEIYGLRDTQQEVPESRMHCHTVLAIRWSSTNSLISCMHQLEADLCTCTKLNAMKHHGPTDTIASRAPHTSRDVAIADVAIADVAIADVAIAGISPANMKAPSLRRYAPTGLSTTEQVPTPK